MAKRKTRREPQAKPKGIVVTTSRGVEVECLPVGIELESQEANIRESVDWPEKPTRVMTDVGGSEVDIELSRDYVESDRATEEQKAAWDAYWEDLARAEAEFQGKLNEAQPRLIAYKGVRLADPSLADKWAEDHEWLGMEVPQDERERSLHFLRTEILGDPVEDMTAIMVGIYRASGFDEEVLAEFEANFRPQMGRPGRAAAGDDTGDPAAAGATQEAGLVEPPGVDGRRGG